MLVPDCIFESSWEVCNKVGGIYTVLSSKALTLQGKFHDRIIFIGPDLGGNPIDFKEDGSLFEDWKQALPNGIKVKTGCWRTPGEPIAMLVAYKGLFDRRDALYYEMWDKFRVDSFRSYGDYDDSCLFACAAALVIENFYGFYKLQGKKVAALFNEWMLGMGALYLQEHVPAIATLFTTHATTIGRSIAGNGKPLYSCMKGYNGDQMAKELNVEAKHSVEKQAAAHADCFTTVSKITAAECTQLLDKTPDAITPNGFESGFVPVGAKYDECRAAARKRLMYVVEKLTGRPVAEDAFLVATSGRYEYRNKGIDVFIDTMGRLRQTKAAKREIVAFLMIPAWVYAARADLKYAVDNGCETSAPMQTPFLTHWLNNMGEDRIMNFILSSGFTNSGEDNLRIVFVPCYLDGRDGIFNKTYYDLLIGMDATVFASYYEPWGYTPLESVAFGVPTVTTNLAGFGLWAESIVSGGDIGEGAAVIKRTDDNYHDVVNNISDTLIALMGKDAAAVRDNCFCLAKEAEWSKFINHYYEAFDKALQNAAKRNAAQ